VEVSDRPPPLGNTPEPIHVGVIAWAVLDGLARGLNYDPDRRQRSRRVAAALPPCMPCPTRQLMGRRRLH
jgi:hypothetical protein